MSYLQNLLHTTPASEEFDLTQLDYSLEGLMVDQESCLRVMQGILKTTASFESGAISLDRYNENVALIFTTAGLRLPTSIITPEFESQDTSIKKKNMFMRLVDYLIERFKQFYNWFFTSKESPKNTATATIREAFVEFKEVRKTRSDVKSTTTADDPSHRKIYKKYVSKQYITDGAFDINKFVTFCNDVVTLNKKIQSFNGQVEDLEPLFNQMKEKSSLVKDKELVEIPFDTDTSKLGSVVESTLEVELNRYLKNLDDSVKSRIKGYQEELNSLRGEISKGADVAERIKEIENTLGVLKIKTTMSPFLSTIGTMVKDATKILDLQ